MSTKSPNLQLNIPDTNGDDVFDYTKFLINNFNTLDNALLTTGGKMTGLLQLATLAFAAAGGIKTDQYGNLTAAGTTATNWNVQDKNGNPILTVMLDGTQALKGLKNILDDGSGNATFQGVITPKKAMALITPVTNFYQSMTGSWASFGGSPAYQYPSYYQTADGMVRLSGAMAGGTNGQFYTMPAGLRPGNKLGFNVSCGQSGAGSTGRVTIDVSGNLSVTTTDNTFVSLDTVAWYAQQ